MYIIHCIVLNMFPSGAATDLAQQGLVRARGTKTWRSPAPTASRGLSTLRLACMRTGYCLNGV